MAENTKKIVDEKHEEEPYNVEIVGEDKKAEDENELEDERLEQIEKPLSLKSRVENRATKALEALGAAKLDPNSQPPRQPNYTTLLEMDDQKIVEEGEYGKWTFEQDKEWWEEIQKYNYDFSCPKLYPHDYTERKTLPGRTQIRPRYQNELIGVLRRPFELNPEYYQGLEDWDGAQILNWENHRIWEYCNCGDPYHQDLYTRKIVRRADIEKEEERSSKGGRRTNDIPSAPLNQLYPFGEKMLKTQGWELGTGLGAVGKGRLQPIQAADHPKKVGIGFDPKKVAKPISSSSDTDNQAPEQFFAMNPEDEHGFFQIFVRKRQYCCHGCWNDELCKEAGHIDVVHFGDLNRYETVDQWHRLQNRLNEDGEFEGLTMALRPSAPPKVQPTQSTEAAKPTVQTSDAPGPSKPVAPHAKPIPYRPAEAAKPIVSTKPFSSLAETRFNPPKHNPETRAQADAREQKWKRCDAVNKDQIKTINTGGTIHPPLLLSKSLRKLKRQAKFGAPTGIPYLERIAQEEAAARAAKSEDIVVEEVLQTSIETAVIEAEARERDEAGDSPTPTQAVVEFDEFVAAEGAAEEENEKARRAYIRKGKQRE